MPELTYDLLYEADDAPVSDFGFCLELSKPDKPDHILAGVGASPHLYSICKDQASYISYKDFSLTSNSGGPNMNGANIEKKRKMFRTLAKQHFAYEDAEIWIYEVSATQTYEGQPVEYAGKTVALEMDGDEMVCTVIPEAPEGSALTSPFIGRIEDILYLKYASYDLKNRTAKLYSDESELPPVARVVQNPFILNRFNKTIQETINSYIGDLQLVDLMTERIGDTVYYLLGTHQRLFHTDGTYPGDTAFLIAYDISGDRIIRIEKYVCANMFVYDAHLFVTGSDGKYYKPYLKTE